MPTTTVPARPRSAWPLLALCTLAGSIALGCSSPSEPGGGGGGAGDVKLEVVSVTPPVDSADANGIAFLTCGVSLKATLEQGTSVSWRGAIFRFYPGTDTSVAFDSLQLGPLDAADSWGGAPLTNRGPALSDWRFYATIPFTVVLDYTYQRQDNSTATTRQRSFTCSPTIPAGAAAPVVSNVSVTPSSGTVQPGDFVKVTFTVSAEAGLWQTAALLQGVCDTVRFLPGHLAKGATTLQALIPVSPSCSLGAPLGVSVETSDIQGRVVWNTPAVSLTVADLTPPSIAVNLGGTPGSTVSGLWFVGDTMHVFASAYDNYRLEELLWTAQPAGVADSLRFGPSAVGVDTKVEVRQEWGALQHLDFRSRDLSGNLSGVASVTASNLTIYPDHPGPTATALVAGATVDAYPDPARGVFYLLLSNQRRLETRSLSDASLIRSVNLPAYTTVIDATASGDSLVFALPDRRSIGFLDLTAATPIVTVHALTLPDTLTGELPQSVAATANGKLLIRLEGGPLAVPRLLELDPATGAEQFRPDAGGGAPIAGGPYPSPGHTMLLVSTSAGTWIRYNSGTDQFTTAQATPGVLGDARISDDGQVVAIGRTIFDAGLSPVRTVQSDLGTGVAPTLLSPDGQEVYYYRSGSLVRARVSDGAILDRSREGVPGWLESVHLSNDGTWVACLGFTTGTSGWVGVVDLR